MRKAARFVVVLSVCLLILTFAFVPLVAASTVEVPLFGPEQFVRDTGSPVTETRQFSVQRLVADSYVLRVGNGSMEGDSLVSSAVITLNGTIVLKQNDFNQGVYSLDKPVGVQATNTLEVKLGSIPTSYLTLTIVGNYLPEDVDDDGDGYTENEGDCIDADAAINPDAPEICDGIDNNCDSQIDEGVTLTFYPDADGDGYGLSNGSIQACSAPAGYAASPGDCDDLSFDVNPGATEVCDGIDNNCDGTTDPGCLTGITVDPASFTLTGTTSTQQLTVTGYYSDNTSQCLTGSSTGTVYTSSDNNVAVVTQEGQVTAAGTGTAVVTAANDGFTTDATVTVQMLPATYVPQPEGSFGSAYEDLVPPDVTLESYDKKRFSVVTGLVQAKDGAPISGVTVSIHGHPEYGSVLTAVDGRFSMPVEGEGTMTVVYGKTGLLSSHRKVYVPWNDIAVVDTITMIQQDYVTTQVMFDGNPATTYTHRATETVDEFGTRALTMIIKGNNRAYKFDEAGNQVWLPIINIRATEYETPESMPAKLPPTSAFTYCVELSVAEAEDIQFEKPITLYVENFLGFDVGMIVPVGYYDFDRAAWVPMNNGVVVRLLDTNTDGVVDALDTDGDGQPDDLNNDGSFSDEVQGLGDPGAYPPGGTFWRAKVGHFSSVDMNFPVVGPPDAVSKSATFGTGDGAAKEGSAQSDQEGDNQGAAKLCPNKRNPVERAGATEVGSYVDHRSRALHEDIPVPGTDIVLHYSSRGTEGYKSVVTVPASGDWVPASLKEIRVKMWVSGKIFSETLNPLPNQTVEFEWDGLDFLGRAAVGSVPVRVDVVYVYDGYYAIPANRAQSFGLPSGVATTIPTREENEYYTEYESITINREGAGTLAKGWTISSHHRLYASDPAVLYKGDGSTVRQKNVVTEDFAGNGTRAYSGDGVPAKEASIFRPQQMTSDAEGNVYICDMAYSAGNHIRKIDRDGIITTIAGKVSGSDADGIPATEASINCTQWGDLEVDREGNIYLSIGPEYTVRKIDTNGIITTIAGNCSANADTASAGWIGDGLPAIESCIHPYGLAIDGEGNLYIGDFLRGSRIRKISTNGVINTIAGGVDDYVDLGDGGPAINATIYLPADVAVDAQGNIYTSTDFGSRVRKVDPQGIITTVAGNGVTAGWDIPACPLCGEGGPAKDASLMEPGSLEIDSDGNLYFLDWQESVVRMVDGSGNLKTVAGTSSWVYDSSYDCNEEGLPATKACFYGTRSFTIDGAGNLYVANPDTNKIMKISLADKLQRFHGPAEVAFAEGGLVYVMSESGLHKRTMEMATGTTLLTFSYDSNNNLVSIADRFGNSTTIERDTGGVPLSITSPDGVVTSLTVDADKNLTQVSYADGTYYEMDYTANGLMTGESHPNGDHYAHVFDSLGRVTEANDATGGVWTFDRVSGPGGVIGITITSAEGEVISYDDRKKSTDEFRSTMAGSDGAPMTFRRSPDGLSEETQTSCGATYSREYGSDKESKLRKLNSSTTAMPSGLSVATSIDRSYEDQDSDGTPDRITDTVTVNGKASTMVNDVLTGAVTATSPTGRQVTSYYSPATLLTSRTSTPGLLDTDFTYDTRGRLETVTVGSRTTGFAYDGFGYLDYMTTPDGRTFDYTYDVMGRLTDESRPDGSQVSYGYDANGNVTAILNPNNVTHGFNYTANDQREAYNTPISGSYTYLYDRDRRLKSVTYPSGQSITNTWGNGHLLSTSTPEGLITYGYDCGGKVGSVTRGGESSSFTYDGSLLLSDTRAGTVNHLIDYTYNGDLQVGSIGYAGANDGFSYDLDGLLTGVGPYTITRNVSNGLPEAVSDGTMTQGRSFSGYGEVDGVGYTVGATAPYSWGVVRDNAGRITRKVENIGTDTVTWDYTYDLMGRVETVYKDSALAEAYSYDAQGNRLSEVNNLRNVSRTYTNSIEDHTLTAGADSYTFDVDGFLTSRSIAAGVYSGTTTFDYSSRGELLSATLPNSDVITYQHDPMGRRIAKRVNGVIKEKYLWADSTTLLAVYDGSDNLIQRFEYADGRMPVSMVYSGAVYYLAYDQVGSLKVVTDSAGTVLKRVDYDSFGNILSDSDPAFTVPFGFAGGLHDKDTGLVRFGARDYDPAIGKWTAKDPIDFAGGDLNLGSYVQNDPVNYFDPSGLLSFLVSRSLLDLPFASHNFIVTNADFIGDPKANVFSFGRNSVGNVGRVAENSPTHRADSITWEALAGQDGTCQNVLGLKTPDVSAISAPDFIVDAYSNSLIENQGYGALGGIFGANSNSAAQAIANLSSQSIVLTPGGSRVTLGIGDWKQIKFNISVLSSAQ